MSALESRLEPKGNLIVRPFRQFPSKIGLAEVLEFGLPNKHCTPEERSWRKSNILTLARSAEKVVAARLLNVPTVIGALFLRRIRGKSGTIENLGLAGFDIVTTSGVTYIASRMANSSPANISLFNFHGLGTGVTAAAIGDTALQTEIANSHYTPSSTRATGTQSNPSGNVYQSVGTNTQATAGDAITEWALYTQAATGTGTILDHMVFAAVNLAVGDSLQTTFQFTIAAGG